MCKCKLACFEEGNSVRQRAASSAYNRMTTDVVYRGQLQYHHVIYPHYGCVSVVAN